MIFGGKSSEFYVSLKTAETMLSALDREKYEITLIGITREGSWHLVKDLYGRLTEQVISEGEAVFADLGKGCFLIGKEAYKPERVLIAMHGEYGEDGRVQGLLDIMGLRYAGADSFSSSLCMDKHLAKLVAISVGVRVAEYFVVHKSDFDMELCLKEGERIGYPLFVKPARCGSSVGVRRVTRPCRLEEAIKNSLLYSDKVLIEKEITGTETEAGVIIKNGKILNYSVGQLSCGGEFYDYFEKYENKRTEYRIPAKISEKTEKELGECLKKLVTALEIKGYARLDFFVTEKEEIVFNEVNTLPGFTEFSMLPMLFKHRGIEKGQLLDILLF